MLNQIIRIKGGFVRAVKIVEDFFDEDLNKTKLESYYPNPSARDAFYSISQGLHPTATDRVHLVSGTYGSGKSHFGLVMVNYLTKNSNSKDLEMVFHRIREREPEKASEIYNMRNVDRPYLPVLLESYDPDGAEHALLKGLREALVDPRRANLPEDVLESSYRSAVDKIEEWQEKKPEFHRELERMLGEGRDVDGLKHDLVPGFNPEAYRLFKELHLRITLSSFIPMYGEDASRIYPEVSGLLIREHEYKGIVVIWDQFNDHLESISTALLGREVSLLRRFVEKVERSGDNQLHVILVSHKLPRTYVRGRISKDSLDNWMTLEGRFHQHTLEAIEESEELISYAVTAIVEEKSWKKAEQAIEDSTRIVDAVLERNLYRDKDRDWIVTTICKGTFPLHPITTYCLPMLSDAVGQVERTMFTFFEERIKKGGLTRFINETPIFSEDGRLSWYTADRLFDFFREAIENTPETRHVMANYAEAMGKVRDPREMLTQRLMKALAILGAIRAKHAIPLSATSSNLALMLDMEEGKLQPLLDSLVPEVLWVRVTGEYEFRTGQVLVDFAEDFRKEREDLDWDNPILVLKVTDPPQDIVAREYEKQYRVARRLSADYIDADGLANVKSYETQIESEYKDAVVLHVVAGSMDEVKEARERAINISHPQLIIAVPKNPVNLYETLRNVKALESLRSKPAYNTEGTEAYRIWRDMYDAETAKMRAEVASWKQVLNLEWFRAGATLDTANKDDTDIADFVMFSVFNKTPIVEHRAMANHWEKDDMAHRVSLNTAILDTKKEEIEYIAKGRRAPAEKTILELTFEPQRMLRKRSEGNFDYYRFVEPDSGNIKEVWDLMKKRLMGAEVRTNFAALINEAQLPPYGLCSRVVELFLSAFLRFYRDHFTIKTKRTKHAPIERRDFIGDTIYDIVNDPDPEKVLVEYREQLPLEEDYLLTVNGIVSPDKTWESRLSPVDGVGELFVEWLQSLPTVTRCSPDVQEKSKKFLEGISEVDKDTDMRELLLERLPKALEIQKGFTDWEKEDLENFESVFKEMVDELNNYPEEVIRKSVGCFKGVFDVKGDTEFDVMEKIRNWYNNLEPAAKEYRFSGSTYQLMKYANIQRTDQFRDKFLVEMPKEVGLGSYRDWQNVGESLERYRQVLSKAKAEVESVQVKVTGKPVSKPTLSKEAESLKASIKEVIDRTVIGRDEIASALESLLEEYRR